MNENNLNEGSNNQINNQNSIGQTVYPDSYNQANNYQTPNYGTQQNTSQVVNSNITSNNTQQTLNYGSQINSNQSANSIQQSAYQNNNYGTNNNIQQQVNQTNTQTPNYNTQNSNYSMQQNNYQTVNSSTQTPSYNTQQQVNQTNTQTPNYNTQQQVNQTNTQTTSFGNQVNNGGQAMWYGTTQSNSTNSYPGANYSDYNNSYGQYPNVRTVTPQPDYNNSYTQVNTYPDVSNIEIPKEKSIDEQPRKKSKIKLKLILLVVVLLLIVVIYIAMSGSSKGGKSTPTTSNTSKETNKNNKQSKSTTTTDPTASDPTTTDPTVSDPTTTDPTTNQDGTNLLADGAKTNTQRFINSIQRYATVSQSLSSSTGYEKQVPISTSGNVTCTTKDGKKWSGGVASGSETCNDYVNAVITKLSPPSPEQAKLIINSKGVVQSGSWFKYNEYYCAYKGKNSIECSTKKLN